MSKRKFRNNHSGDIHPEYHGRSSQTNFPKDWTEVFESVEVEPEIAPEVEPEIAPEVEPEIEVPVVDVSTPAIPPAPQAKAKSNGNKRGSN